MEVASFKIMSIDIDKLDEKRRLEVYAVKYFSEALQRHYNRQLTIEAVRDHPDVSCILGDVRIDIEVAHLYGSKRDARMIYGRTRDYEKNMADRIAHALVPLNERVISDLNSILEEKAQKRYGGKTWLLIRNAYPLWNREDFELYFSNIIIPAGHSFEEIWLLCDRDGRSGILRLYPQRSLDG